MAVIAMLNRKGGVGKSTSTFNLAGTMAKAGRRILLVDADPQSSLTQGIFGPEATSGMDPLGTIAAAYAGEVADPEQVIRPTGFDRVAIIPGSEAASPFETGLPHEQPWERQTCLAELLGDLQGEFDHVLIDCPPALGMASWAALAAADRVLIPTQCEDYGSQGLPLVMAAIEAARVATNPRIEILGLLLTMFQARRSLHTMYADLLRQQYGRLVLDTVVPAAAEVPEATMLRKPVVHHKPKGAASKAFAALAEEIESRLALPAATEQGEAA